MTHPLTDEKCNKLSIFDLDECSAAYAYGIMADMRAAADWQLEQDAEAWRIILNRMKILHPLIVDSIIEEFKQAMRPQEDK